MEYKSMIPNGTAITWDDVYRFSGNNFIGRKARERFMKENDDAGKCLAAMVDFVGERYIPANKYIALSKHDIAPEAFETISSTLADEMATRRHREGEPREYWKFVFDNSIKALEEYIGNNDLS